MATPAKVSDLDYIPFLLAAQTAFACVEAANTHGAPDQTPAQDAYTRLLTRQPPDTEALWQETKPFVTANTGLLVADLPAQHPCGGLGGSPARLGDDPVFTIVCDDLEEVAFWATNDLSMTEPTRQQVAAEALAIEE
jgi:hypothetical protein